MHGGREVSKPKTSSKKDTQGGKRYRSKTHGLATADCDHGALWVGSFRTLKRNLSENETGKSHQQFVFLSLAVDCLPQAGMSRQNPFPSVPATSRERLAGCVSEAQHFGSLNDLGSVIMSSS